ncbi:MAG: hypothetical protein RL693_1110, partial [Verrucomicrobiota bacterium]
AAAFLSATGFIHAYHLTPNGVENHFAWFTAAPDFAVVYAVASGVLMGLAVREKSNSKSGNDQLEA